MSANRRTPAPPPPTVDEIVEAALDAAIAEMWGFDYGWGGRVTVSEGEVRDMVRDALTAALPLLLEALAASYKR